MNPGGSVKDRAALAMIRAMEDEGELKEGGTVVEGTGGNTGVALSMLVAAHANNPSKRYKCVLTMPTSVAAEKVATMRATGATVELCDTKWGVKDPGHYTRRAKAIAAATPGAVHTDQFSNAANRRAHETGTAPELLSQAAAMGLSLTGFACAAGTGGTIAGVAKHLAEASPETQVALVDCQGSGLKAYLESGEFKKGGHEGGLGDTLAEGIGIGRLVVSCPALCWLGAESWLL